MASVPPVYAVPVPDVPIGTSHLNVEYADFLGMGSEASYLVLDFGAAGGGSFAFGYRHDGTDTALDMLDTFAAAGVLEVIYEDFFGPAIRGISYPREQQAEVFPSAFDGPRSWVLWDGTHQEDRVEWTTAEVGINGIRFGDSEPTVFLPAGGFYGLTTWSPDDFPGPPPLVPLPGDFDSNGVVDGDDLLDALLGFGTTTGPTLAAGDADRDGKVDRADFMLWQQNAGAGTGTAAAAYGIPEPGALLLAAASVFVALASKVNCRISQKRPKRPFRAADP